MSTATGRAVTGQLALVEARRLLRSPIVIGAAILMLAVRTATTWNAMPIWRVVADGTEYTSLILALAALLAGHRAAGRDHRYGMAEVTRTLPAPPRRRTVALLAAVPAVALVAAAVVGVHLLSLTPDGVVGPFDGWDLLASVALPVLGVTTGIALARWLPSAASGALGLFAAAMVPGIATFGISDPDSPVHAVSPLLHAQAVVFDVPPRPTGWHLAYLLALTAVATAVALLRHRRRLVPGIVVGVAVAVAVTACVAKIHAASEVVTEARMTSFEAPAAYDCRRHDDVTYCAFHGFQDWIERWESAVRPVVAAVPAAGRTGLPRVRQIDNLHSIDPALPTEVLVPTGWGRHEPWAARSRAELTVWYALGTVGLPGPNSPSRSGDIFAPTCQGGGQPRTVVALWLAAQALPDGAARLAARTIDLSPVHYGAADAAAAGRLLARPRAEVTAAVAPIWSRIIDPAAGPDALTPLGLPAVSTRARPEDLPTCR